MVELVCVSLYVMDKSTLSMDDLSSYIICKFSASCVCTVGFGGNNLSKKQSSNEISARELTVYI